jgi:hypothetical protein
LGEGGGSASWGWFYLSTILDDFSRYIIAWKLCTTMRADDVTDTLQMALTASGCASARVAHKPRLLSDNGSSYVSGDLAKWLDFAVKDGRRVVALIDHLELYRKSPEAYEKWRAERGFEARYPVGPAGHAALFADFDRAAKNSNLIVFKAWEIYEGELDSGIEEAPMRMVDLIGWHISPNNGGNPPDGKLLLKRVAQIKEIQKRFPIPMILFHPFPMRLENLQRTAKAAGRDKSTITKAEYRFFQPGEQEALAAALRGTSIYVEISQAQEQYFEDPVTRQALIEDIRPLADLGVQFTVSTDAHGVRDASKPFHPATYCDALGITPANTNSVVRELLAIRAKRSSKP